MGLSVSASAAVVFLGMFLAAGILLPAVGNGLEQVAEARGAAEDRALAQANTAVNVTDATYNASNDTLVVRAANEGTTALTLSETDLLADNEYVAFNASVEGNADTNLWLPGETARFEVSLASEPNRTTVVVEHGVSDGEVV